MKKELTGLIPAVISPLGKDGSLDSSLLKKQTEYLSRAGASGFFVAGTTGEGAFLSRDEKRLAFNTIKEVSEARHFLCLACLQPSTEQVIAEMRELDDLSPDYIVAVTPYYGKADQDAIYTHFMRIADASQSPLILYSIPPCTHNVIELPTINRLSVHPNIIGIKDSTGDLMGFSRGILARESGRGTAKDFKWIMGEDYLDSAALFLGADALVSGLSNVRAEPYAAMFNAAKEERWEDVRSMQEKINTLYDTVTGFGSRLLVSIKNGAAFYSRSSESMKIPGIGLSNEERKILEEVLKNYDS